MGTVAAIGAVGGVAMNVAGQVMASGAANKARRKLRDAKRYSTKYIRKGYAEAAPIRDAMLDTIRGYQGDNPTGAMDLMRAYSGASGEQAQRQAFEGFQDSPGVAWLRDRGLRGIDRNASARGGLGGGNRMKALTAYSQGLAEQSYQRRFAELGLVANNDRDLLNSELGVMNDQVGDRLGLATQTANIELGASGGSAQLTQAAGLAKANAYKVAGEGFAGLAGLAAGAFSGPTTPPPGAGGGGGGYGNITLGFDSTLPGAPRMPDTSSQLNWKPPGGW